MFVLTLIASTTPLKAAHLGVIEGILDPMGLRLSLSPPVWLAPHKAADLFIEDKPNQKQMGELRQALDHDKIDILVSRTGVARRKLLLLADMDATIVTTETLDELAGHVGLHEKISAITMRAMNGDLDFHEALRERVSLLKDLSVESLFQTLMKTDLSEGAETLVRTMSAHGATCVLVSGGFTFFTSAIMSLCGFHHNHGNSLEIVENKLTGRVLDPILDKDAKLSFLKSYAAQQSLDLHETLAVGDGANDLPMLEAAGLGVGYRPKKLLTERLFNIVQYSDLTSLLFAQGYKEDEFIHRQTH